MKTRLLSATLSGALLLGLVLSVSADEGMWTYNNVPKDKIKAKYGFSPDDKWLEHARLSSARLAGGCSASFVSENGLILTNHHCAHDCIRSLSSADKDYVKNGFYAKTVQDEPACPGYEINQLVDISDVTDRMAKATKGLTDEKYNQALKAEQAKIEKECATSDKVRCDVVSLYHGGTYNLYKYKRFQDVHLVFAPEYTAAFFGGDPDNFMFPRYDLDVSFLRIYEDGKPAHTENFFKWSQGGAKDGDLAFVSGHPGGTDRLLTVAELEYQRDVEMVNRLLRLAEFRGMLSEYRKKSTEAERFALEDLFYVENSFKAIRGEHQALLDKDFFTQKIAAEKDFRAKIDANPEWQKKYGGAWDAIAKAENDLKAMRKDLSFIERSSGFASDIYQYARMLVRAADELKKPNDKRFPEFRDSVLPAVKQHLLAPVPYSEDFEIATLGWSLTKLREELGPDNAFVKKVLGKDSPDEVAARLVKGSKLSDPAVRAKLWDDVQKNGKKALAGSTDTMIKLAQLVDADGRAVRKKYEDNVEAVLKKNDELIARARFDVYGQNTYPDATFTLRLSYGAVKGYMENGKQVKPLTTFAGAFERHTGADPFALPDSWIKAKGKLDLSTPLNFCTTNDIIGGNSGSPVFNKDGEIIGLIFDGNIQSLGGNYGFDESVNRAVAVHSEAIIQALAKIYGADRIVSELRPAKKTGK